jgi:hypothetical protein
LQGPPYAGYAGNNNDVSFGGISPASEFLVVNVPARNSSWESRKAYLVIELVDTNASSNELLLHFRWW